VSTLAVGPEAAARIAIARSLARRIDDADEANASGAVLAAVPGLSRQLGEQLDDIVALCASKVDPLLAYLNDDTGQVPHPPGGLAHWEDDPANPGSHILMPGGAEWEDTPWPRRVNGRTIDHNDPVDPDTGERL